MGSSSEHGWPKIDEVARQYTSGRPCELEERERELSIFRDQGNVREAAILSLLDQISGRSSLDEYYSRVPHRAGQGPGVGKRTCCRKISSGPETR